MSIAKDNISPDLNSWDAIKSNFEGAALLIGNGASLAVWGGFDYPSLFERATSGSVQQALTEKDKALFKSEDNTTNFETVLSNLAVTQAVCQALEVSSSFADERYTSIQRSMVSAVHAVHVPYSAVDAALEVLPSIRNALWEYPRVYSTNYDLLLYWAIMSGPEEARHVDHFFTKGSNRFDITDADIFHGKKGILYLHGGLHLVRLSWGGTRKVQRDTGGALLDKFGQDLDIGESPLVVTEGTSANKVKSIYASDYLRFAYDRFCNEERSLVIFGHSLRASDHHLVEAIKRHESRPVAVSVRGHSSTEIKQCKTRYQAILSPIEPVFFDATTHPLGAAALKVSKV